MLYFLLRLVFKVGVHLPYHGAGREGFFPLPLQITDVSSVKVFDAAGVEEV